MAERITYDRPVTNEELAQYSSNFEIVNALAPVAATRFQFVAAFDGTWNSRNDPALSNAPNPTNVDELQGLVQQGDETGSQYYPGVGSRGPLSRLIGASLLPEYEVVTAAEDAYRDFVNQAQTWREKVAASLAPEDRSPERISELLDISVSSISFSRGATSQLMFARMLHERGLPDIRTSYEVQVTEIQGEQTIVRTETRYSVYLKSPGEVPVAAMLMYDPVGTFVPGNMSVSPNVRSVLVVGAKDEHRASFAAMQLTDPNNPDPRIQVLWNAGAHSDIGGGYDYGLGALNLRLGHLFLERSGIGMAEIPPTMQPNPAAMQVHNSAVKIFTGDYVEDRPIRQIWKPAAEREPYQPIGMLENSEISPLGNNLYLKSTIDGAGRTSAQLLDAGGRVLLQANQGDVLTRDPETGRVTVTGAAGQILGEYTPLNISEISPPDLADEFAASVANLGGTFGAGQVYGFDVLPVGEGSSFLVNADAEIVGELNVLPDGYLQLRNLSGEAIYVAEDGRELTQAEYDQAQTHAPATTTSGSAIASAGALTKRVDLDAGGSWITTLTDASGRSIVTIKRTAFHDDDGVSYLDEAENRITGEQWLVGTDTSGTQKQVQLVSFEQAQAAVKDAMFSDSASFLSALRGKNKAATLLYGAKIAIDYARYNDLANPDLKGLSDFVGGAAGVLGVLGALRGLQSDDPLTQVNGAVSLLHGTDAIYKSFNDGASMFTPGAAKLLGSVGAVLSIANLANLDDMLENGQYGSAVMTSINAINGAAYLAPGGTSSLMGSGAFLNIPGPWMVGLVIASFLIDDLFSEEPPPPPPMGEASFTRGPDGTLSFQIRNENDEGRGILTSEMTALVTKLNAQLAAANQGNTDPDRALELIVSRMPSVSIQGWPSFETGTNYFFVVTQDHPISGEKMFSGIARQDMVAHYAETLVLPQAIVQHWEVAALTARYGAEVRSPATSAQPPVRMLRLSQAQRPALLPPRLHSICSRRSIRLIRRPRRVSSMRRSRTPRR
jgi:hypothetical protein